ncbi:hypothetical protein A1OE_500 [Candidatus Endolissoclinum faulkneri L2]|uniref:Uncharacterized protein n=1 Tax=Candidatus Endolissoclinum faulkneri L2 TaxID=1193729 RepID=K7Z3W4_9PROT|nr:hypothetical protein A1OE_500 [Candidatus Endolissoclinum faulkneri L2]
MLKNNFNNYRRSDRCVVHIIIMSNMIVKSCLLSSYYLIIIA